MKKTALEMIIEVIIGVGGGLAAFLFGDIDGVFYALIAVVSLDYFTGVIDAIIHKQLSSEIGYKGILKKVLIFIVVAVANLIDVHATGESGVLRTAVIFFFMANEGISILENAANMGIPIPKKLIALLTQIKNSNNESEVNKHE